MKVLVTGANGFLANNVIRELNKRSVAVRALVRPAANIHPLADLNAEIFRGDFTNRESADSAVDGCDAVMHLAADTSQNYSANNFNLECNVNGTRNLIESSVQHKIRRFIYVSTANAFAHGTMETPGDECSPFRYPFTESGYAVSKLRAQELVLSYSTGNQTDIIVLNPTFMIGPHDYKPGSGRIITMMYKRRIIPVPPGGKNFIHVKDAAVALCNALTMGHTGNCYLLANENLSYLDFYKKMAAIAGKKYSFLKLNSMLLSMAGTLGDTLRRVSIKTDINSFNLRILCEGNYFINSKAVRELELPCTSIDEAIADALEWFGKNGYLD